MIFKRRVVSHEEYVRIMNQREQVKSYLGDIIRFFAMGAGCVTAWTLVAFLTALI